MRRNGRPLISLHCWELYLRLVDSIMMRYLRQVIHLKYLQQHPQQKTVCLDMLTMTFWSVFNPHYIGTTQEISSTGRLAELTVLIRSKSVKKKLFRDEIVAEAAGGKVTGCTSLAISDW
jgi:hypothetical protein